MIIGEIVIKRSSLPGVNNDINTVESAGISLKDQRNNVNTKILVGNRGDRIGFIVISVGVLIAASSGSWDITNHLLNKPETFFSAPHAGLYAGVALVIIALVFILRHNRTNSQHIPGYRIVFTSNKGIDRQKSLLAIPIKIIIVGVALLAIAGPFDFAWHSAFGLDGLLSPSHLVLALGLVLSSTGSLLGTISMNELVYFYNKNKTNFASVFSGSGIHVGSNFNTCNLSLFIVVGVIPVWITLVGLVHMLSLPFSETSSFNFNPNPNAAAIFVTLALSLLVSFIAIASFRLTRNLGIITIIGLAFVTINLLTSIYPNDYLHSTIYFYVLNIIPFLAIDVTLHKFENSTRKIYVYAISGVVLGATFFFLHYPLITYTYNEVSPNPGPVWPSITVPIYFKMVNNIYPLLLLPSLSSGLLGAILALRVTSPRFRSLTLKLIQ
jgi:hypothetical protein